MEQSVQTQLHQLSKPNTIPADSNGIKLLAHSVVAYNKSGAVRIGTIKGVARWEWKKSRDGVDGKSWWSLKSEVHIIERDTNTISKVKNPNGIMVLKSDQWIFI